MPFQDDPEFLAQNPTSEEIDAVRLIAQNRPVETELTSTEAIEILRDVRKRQQEIEYGVLQNLREKTHSRPGSNPQVDRVYRMLIVITVIALIIYIYSRATGSH